MTARIIGYGYSEGPAAQAGAALAATAALQSVNAIAITEQAYPATTVYARTAATARLTDQLSAWGTSLSLPAPAGGIGGVYSLSWDATARRIVFTGSVSFRPTMPANVASWLGFTQNLSSGWAGTWTGAQAPGGIVDLVAALVEPVEDWAQVDLEEYEHGRPVATAWGNHQAHRVTLVALGEAVAALQLGFLQTGRVRIYQDITDATAYAYTNPQGYIDGYVVAASDPVEDGAAGELWTVRMVVGVPR